jgi:hypothetical protein
MVVTAMPVPNRPAAGRVDDAADDDDGRQRRRFQRDREALDDVGAVAGHRRWAIEFTGRLLVPV